MVTIRRFGAMSYGLVENPNGSWLSVVDVVAWLRELTDEDSQEAMINKIDAMKEELDGYDN